MFKLGSFQLCQNPLNYLVDENLAKECFQRGKKFTSKLGQKILGRFFKNFVKKKFVKNFLVKKTSW